MIQKTHRRAQAHAGRRSPPRYQVTDYAIQGQGRHPQRVGGRRAPRRAVYLPDPISNSARGQIAEFALRHRLPSMHAIREYVEASGLMSYGANTPEMFKIMAEQVAQILDGARPGDVPLIQATGASW